jgi:hypothetical protein
MLAYPRSWGERQYSLKQTGRKTFLALVIGFGGQIAGSVTPTEWRLTHHDFETGAHQIRAHWLIWSMTLVAIVVAALALGEGRNARRHRGYLIVHVANFFYAIVSVIHLLQQLNRQEIEYAPISLAVTNVAVAIGVLWTIAAYVSSKRQRMGGGVV